MALSLAQQAKFIELKKKYGYEVAQNKEFMSTLDEASLFNSFLFQEFYEIMHGHVNNTLGIAESSSDVMRLTLIGMGRVMKQILSEIALEENHEDMVKNIFEEVKAWDSKA